MVVSREDIRDSIEAFQAKPCAPPAPAPAPPCGGALPVWTPSLAIAQTRDEQQKHRLLMVVGRFARWLVEPTTHKNQSHRNVTQRKTKNEITPIQIEMTNGLNQIASNKNILVHLI